MKLKTLVVATALSLASLAANAASLNSLSGPLNWKLQGTSTEVGAGTYGNESTWAIGQITEIKQTNGDPAWSTSADGEYLYFMLYGIADLSIIGPSAGSYNIYNVGCTGGADCDGKIHIDIYRSATAISGILSKNPADRIDFNEFTGLTSIPELYLALEMVPGKVLLDDGSTGADETTAALFQNANSFTLPATGTGTFFAEAVGGTAMAQWDSNGFLGGAADFDGNFTLKVNNIASGGACTDAAIAAGTCFAGLINDPIQSNAIPEPGTLALLGAALAGLGFTRRRKV